MSNAPHNTAADDTFTKLLTAASASGIESQERAGQAELLNSTALPSDLGRDQSDYEALGFVFGEVDAHDPMFRQVQIPEGWTRVGSEHAMHSYIVDERGIQRVNVFYKAAFYDRRADMNIMNVGYAMSTEFIYGDAKGFVLRDDLTDEELDNLEAGAENYIASAESNPDIYKDRLPRAWQIVVALAARCQR